MRNCVFKPQDFSVERTCGLQLDNGTGCTTITYSIEIKNITCNRVRPYLSVTLIFFPFTNIHKAEENIFYLVAINSGEMKHLNIYIIVLLHTMTRLTEKGRLVEISFWELSLRDLGIEDK